MVVPLIEIYESEPLRALDWRWQLAGDLAESPRRLLKSIADDATVQAARHRRRMAHGKRSSAEKNLRDAIELRQSQGDATLKIEARLLSGQTIEEVSRRVGNDQSVVEMYSDLFFDVRNRLDAIDSIQCRALSAPDSDRSQATLAKLFIRQVSYFGGPLVAEAVLKHLSTIRKAIALELDFRAIEPPEARKLASLAILSVVPLPREQVLKLAETTIKNDWHQDDFCEDVFGREVDQKMDDALAEALSHAPTDAASSRGNVYREQAG